MSAVDDLFSGAPPPARPAVDPLRRTRVVLVAAAALTFAGPFLYGIPSVPGAFLAIWAWQSADDALARVDNGSIEAAHREKVTATRKQAFGVMAAAALSIALQLIAVGACFALQREPATPPAP